MKIIINKFIPFNGYVAFTFYNIIFWREEYKNKLNGAYKNKVINHESIHNGQMKDFCKFIPLGGTIFYIIYTLEWIYRLLFTKDFLSHKAYKHISFEREAYENENNMEYIYNRKKFAQWL